MLFGQLIFDGLAMGLIFVILASGLVLIMNGSKILFMAYGAFYTIGAYATWYAFSQLNLPYFLSLVLGVLFAAVIAALCYILVFQRLMSNEQGFLATMIASIGLMMVLNQGGLLIYGTAPRSIPPVFSGTLHWLGINITVDRLVLVLLSITLTLLLFLIYEKTSLGRAIRSVVFLPEAAALQGINVNRVYLAVLVLGCALAGFAGGILAPSYGISPQMGNNVLWSVMLMTMFGGMGSLLGAALGGLLVGQILSFGQFYIGSSIQIILFAIIGIVLYFKPNGLIGRGVDVGI